MFLEYISAKVSVVRCVDSIDSISTTDGHWFCGTYGHKQDNRLSIWRNNRLTEDNIELKSQVSVPVTADVTQISPIDGSTVAATLANGHILCLTFSDKELRLRHKWDSMDGYSSNDSVVNRLANELVVCGDNGVIRVFKLDDYSKPEMTSKCLTQNSLKTIDLISGHEVVCGTSSGHLKVYDLRSRSVGLSMANELSVVTCVRRNPNIAHVIACGNDVGVVSVWDLRNNGQQLLQVSAHSSFISDVKYKANEPNVLMTSSYDGSLLRWNMTASTQLGSVDAIVGREGGPVSAINSFDINSFDEMLFSADNEVLYLGHL